MITYSLRLIEMASTLHTTEKALKLLRQLPRVTLGNIRDNPNSKQNVSAVHFVSEVF